MAQVSFTGFPQAPLVCWAQQAPSEGFLRAGAVGGE